MLSHRLSMSEQNNALKKYKIVSFARFIDLAMKELSWKLMVKEKVLKLHANGCWLFN